MRAGQRGSLWQSALALTLGCGLAAAAQSPPGPVPSAPPVAPEAEQTGEEAPSVLLDRAREVLAQGLCEEAAETLAELEPRAGETASLWREVGDCYYAAIPPEGDPERSALAGSAYGVYLRLAGSDVAVERRAEALASQVHDAPDAGLEAEAEARLRRDPSDGEALQLLSAVRAGAGDFDGALAYAEMGAAVQGGPEGYHRVAFLCLGAAFGRNREDGALAPWAASRGLTAADRALAFDPSEWEGYFLRAAFLKFRMDEGLREASRETDPDRAAWLERWAVADAEEVHGALLAGQAAREAQVAARQEEAAAPDDPESALPPATDAERSLAALRVVRSLAGAVQSFAVDYGLFPQSPLQSPCRDLDDLARQSSAGAGQTPSALSPDYIQELPAEDPWGAPYLYESDGEHFLLVCAGPDGQLDAGYEAVRSAVLWGTIGEAEKAAEEHPGDDILWADGQLLAGPEPPAEPAPPPQAGEADASRETR